MRASIMNDKNWQGILNLFRNCRKSNEKLLQKIKQIRATIRYVENGQFMGIGMDRRNK